MANRDAAVAPVAVFQSTYVGDDRWPSMWNTIQAGKQPFKYIDHLEIAFADINASDPDNAFLYYADSVSDKVTKTVAEAKKEKPNICIVAQMNYTSYLSPLVADSSKSQARLDAFAKSIPPLLKNYGLAGIDFDWESVPYEMTTDDSSYLFSQTRAYLKDDGLPFMSITPDTLQALEINVVNDLFDAVIAQSYGRVFYIDDFITKGIRSSKLYCGIDSEAQTPPDLTPYTDKVKQYNLPGLYAWRIDNDDTDLQRNVPRYTTTTAMWTYSRGTPPAPPLYP
jgi:GH18 family chitinase